MYKKESPVEIQTPTQSNLIGRSMAKPLPVSSPSSILPLLPFYNYFSSIRKNSVCA